MSRAAAAPLRASDIGLFELFRIGVGPSSSHTVGPLLAARRFRAMLAQERGAWALHVELFGSLSATGRGHWTGAAVCAGLLGLDPESSAVEDIWGAQASIAAAGGFALEGAQAAFDPARDVRWMDWRIDAAPLAHPNTLRFVAASADGETRALTARSVGGGFVEYDGGETDMALAAPAPHGFDTAAELMAECAASGLPPAAIAMANAAARYGGAPAVRARLDRVWSAMESAIAAGLSREGELPGGLGVQRRAAGLYAQCRSGKLPPDRLPDLRASAYAMAVSEENAAGGRVVTAPTNGSAGVLPAVFRELTLEQGVPRAALHDGLLVAALIAALVKRGASISGAEVGCQGEIGTSCAMAAGGAAAMLGGTLRQIEAAAEIALEHHLGLTCDPVGGLVQIPCIERNAVGAVKALNAAALALASDGSHRVSLDRAIRVMRQTGHDLKQKYRETGHGGLGVG